MVRQTRVKDMGLRPNPQQSGTAPRLYQRVYDIVAELIRAGEIGPADSLSEGGLAARFGISRAPARQALAQLEKKGLVQKMGGRGGYRIRSDASAEADINMPASALIDVSQLISTSSWERIYGEVEKEIVARTSFASWQVNEAKLARHYNVSRTVARDVVGRLQHIGVLRKDSRTRWYAPAITPARVAELYELRAVLEPFALAKAAPNIPRSLLEEMHAALEAAGVSRGNVANQDLDKLEEDMHVRLLMFCGNQVLMEAIALHQSLLTAHRFLYRWAPHLFENRPCVPEHLDVVDGLLRGDVPAAAAALERHLLISRDRWVARVDTIVREFRPGDLPYLERIDQS